MPGENDRQEIQKAPESTPVPFQLPETVEDLTPEQYRILRAMVQSGKSGTYSIERHSAHVGPLPEVTDYERYAQIIPDGGNRIMVMAEKEQEHSHAMDHRRETRATWGTHWGGVIGMAGVVGSVVAICLGQPIAGTILGGGTLVTMVTSFLQAHKTKDD